MKRIKYMLFLMIICIFCYALEAKADSCGGLSSFRFVIKDKETGQLLSDARFEIRTTEDQFNSSNGKLVAKAGEVIAIIGTDKQGKFNDEMIDCDLTWNNIEGGEEYGWGEWAIWKGMEFNIKYQIREIKAPDGYKIDDTVYEFTIKAKKNGKSWDVLEPVDFTFENTKMTDSSDNIEIVVVPDTKKTLDGLLVLSAISIGYGVFIIIMTTRKFKSKKKRRK